MSTVWRESEVVNLMIGNLPRRNGISLLVFRIDRFMYMQRLMIGIESVAFADSRIFVFGNKQRIFAFLVIHNKSAV